MPSNLKAGELDKTLPGVLGKNWRLEQRKRNTRQYRYAFSAINALAGGLKDVTQFTKIEQSGKAVGLNPASDASAVLIVHVNEPGNTFYVTPGMPKPIPEGFDVLFLERPTQPNVPNRADLFYIIDVSDKSDGIVYGPLPPSTANSGADNYNAPGEATVLVLTGAAGAPQAVFAARAARRRGTIKNVSPGVETVYVTLDPTTVGQSEDTAGLVAILAPGEQWSDAYTGAVSVFASAVTAEILPYELF
jgi:hypothetical protein